MRSFSIIVPLYNKHDYIDRCLKSLLNQIYRSFEIIVINDGSTDGGEDIVASINDPRLFLYNQKNQGVSVARNNGVGKATNEHIVFIDADDTWEEDFLVTLNNLIDQYPHAGIHGINHFFKYANGFLTYTKYDKLFDGKESGILTDYYALFADLGKSPFSNSGFCISKKVFNSVGGYKPGVKVTEDSDLWCRVALHYTIAFYIHPKVTYYLETPNNTRSVIDKRDFQVSQTLQEKLTTREIPERLIESVKKLVAFQQLSLIKRALITGNNLFAMKKLLDKRLFKYFPVRAVGHLIFAFIPHSLFILVLSTIKRISK